MKRAMCPAATLAAVAGAGWAREERAVKASAAWAGQGWFIPTGKVTEVFFVGAFTGIWMDGRTDK